MLTALIAGLPASVVHAQVTTPRRTGHDSATVSKQSEFHDTMRELWAEHVSWTRAFIVSVAGNLPDRKVVTDRLLKNQEDLGDAIKPYYGDDAGNQLTTLLKEHITIAAEAVDAAKANQTPQFDGAKQRWEGNADSLAAFLARANPRHWQADDLRSMLGDHLNLTLEEASARLKGDWKGDIEAYDKVFDQAMRMADGLSDGIIHQFPQKFQGAVSN
jgi:hypothetical protein